MRTSRDELHIDLSMACLHLTIESASRLQTACPAQTLGPPSFQTQHRLRYGFRTQRISDADLLARPILTIKAAIRFVVHLFVQPPYSQPDSHYQHLTPTAPRVAILKPP